MDNVPFAALEVISTRHDRTIRNICIAFVISVCVLAITNCVMFCVWCRRVNKNVDENKQEIVSLIEEVYDEQAGN